MDARTQLEANLVSESEAYGYTLCIWGAGALLVDAYGVPGVTRTLAYVAGALLGFGALAVVAFRGFTETAAVSESPSSLVASTIHIGATGGTLLGVHGFLLVAGDGAVPLTFAGVGCLVTVAYNLLLLLEAFLVRRMA
ncbi:MAG: hypothetical protein ABEH81_01915 [Halopenitus sp.]